jgi:hypothetical protein
MSDGRRLFRVQFLDAKNCGRLFDRGRRNVFRRRLGRFRRCLRARFYGLSRLAFGTFRSIRSVLSVRSVLSIRSVLLVLLIRLVRLVLLIRLVLAIGVGATATATATSATPATTSRPTATRVVGVVGARLLGLSTRLLPFSTRTAY